MPDADTQRVSTKTLLCYSQQVAITERQLLDALSRMPFADSAELTGILGEPHATVHRWLSDLLTDGVVGRVSHGIAHLPSSQRYFITANGLRKATEVLDFDTPSDYVRAYPMSREWLTLLMRRMDAVASVYRLAASMSHGIDGLGTRVEFHRRGRFDATITRTWTCPFPPSFGRSRSMRRPTATPWPASTWTRPRAGTSQTGPSSGR